MWIKRTIPVLGLFVILLGLTFIVNPVYAVTTEIIDATGDGGGNTLDLPLDIAVDGAGNVYVAGRGSANAFKITPGGVITEIIDSTGDGGGNTFDAPTSIAVDGAGNVYVGGGFSDNAFKITPGGVITEIIDSTGDGGGNTLSDPRGIAVDGAGNVYVAGFVSDNAFKLELDCDLPTPGLDYVISSSCTLSSTVSVDKNVIVQNNSVLTIPSGVTLDINFSQFNLTVKSGSGVLIKAGGTIT